MPFVSINSVNDPEVMPYRDLPQQRLGKRSGLFVVEGSFLVDCLLDSSFETVSLFVERRRADEFVEKVSQEVPMYVADKSIFQQILGFPFHRGVLACGRRQANRTFQHLMTGLQEEAILVVGHDVKDPQNLGGILRNCAAFGVDGVLLGTTCADRFSRRVLRTSMGAVLKLAIVESKDMVTDLTRLGSGHQFQRCAAVLSSMASPLDSMKRAARMALLFGNEAKGVSEELVSKCDHCVTIPMKMGTDSLNVSVASGIFLYQFTSRI